MLSESFQIYVSVNCVSPIHTLQQTIHKDSYAKNVAWDLLKNHKCSSADWSNSPTVQILIISGMSLADQSCIRVDNDCADRNWEIASRIWYNRSAFNKIWSFTSTSESVPSHTMTPGKPGLLNPRTPSSLAQATILFLLLRFLMWWNQIDFLASLAFSWYDLDGLLRLLSSCKFETAHHYNNIMELKE